MIQPTEYLLFLLGAKRSVAGTVALLVILRHVFDQGNPFA